MSFDIIRLFKEAESLADQRRLIPALKAWEEAKRIAQISSYHGWASYNLGVANWVLLGDGLAAHREFLSCIAEFETHGYGENAQFKLMHANALENAMLCALSFDEFEELAAKLDVLKPGVPILVELVPRMRQARESGDTWLSQLFSIASSYYNRNDPKIDRGRYGEAKSTYHLILAHRRELRVSHEFWRIAVIELCALSARMAADCMRARGDDQDMHSPEEFLSILTEAIPLADEYLELNSGDDSLKNMRQNLGKMVELSRQRWASFEKSLEISKKNAYSSSEVKTYKNKRYNFKIEIPEDWKVRGLFSGSAPNPELEGPNGASLKFAIGQIVPEPTAKEQQQNLERIATRCGHIVQKIGYITIQGKEHATMTCTVPNSVNALNIIIKNYSIIYKGLEYLATARIDKFPEEEYDGIVETFRFT